MEGKKTDFLIWVKVHKKQLILAGVSITIVVGIILGIKNKDVLVELWAVLEKRVSKVQQAKLDTDSTAEIISGNGVLAVPRNYTRPKEPVPVDLHIRNLCPGRVHSAEKAAEAEALGIILMPNQTLVDPYMKYAA